MLTASQAAKMLGVHINTIRRWSAAELIKCYRVGPRGDRRFKEEDVRIFLLKQYNLKEKKELVLLK